MITYCRLFLEAEIEIFQSLYPDWRINTCMLTKIPHESEISSHFLSQTSQTTQFRHKANIFSLASPSLSGLCKTDQQWLVQITYFQLVFLLTLNTISNV
jgi:hypothetical protein